MDDSAKKGIEIPDDLLRRLSTLCAGSSHSADALRSVLKSGRPQPESGAGEHEDTTFVLEEFGLGGYLVAVAARDVTAAWLRPFIKPELELRSWEGRPVDPRGSAALDPRRAWFSDGMVDVYNAEVTNLGDITKDWHG